MKMKDFGNTFNINKPQKFEQKINKNTGTYNSTDENGNEQQKNIEFTKMNNNYLLELAKLSAGNGLARAILDIMSYTMELNNTYIVSQNDLVEIFAKDLRTIRRAIEILRDREE